MFCLVTGKAKRSSIEFSGIPWSHDWSPLLNICVICGLASVWSTKMPFYSKQWCHLLPFSDLIYSDIKWIYTHTLHSLILIMLNKPITCKVMYTEHLFIAIFLFTLTFFICIIILKKFSSQPWQGHNNNANNNNNKNTGDRRHVFSCACDLYFHTTLSTLAAVRPPVCSVHVRGVAGIMSCRGRLTAMRQVSSLTAARQRSGYVYRWYEREVSTPQLMSCIWANSCAPVTARDFYVPSVP